MLQEKKKRIIQKVTADFSAETLQDRRLWDEMLTILKKKVAKQEYYILQSYPSDMRDSKKIPLLKMNLFRQTCVT